jgi:hypothetical protein
LFFLGFPLVVLFLPLVSYHYELVDLPDDIAPKAFPKMRHHRRFKRLRVSIPFKSQKVLQVRILPYLLNRFLVAQIELFLDDQRPQGNSHRFRLPSLLLRKAFFILLFYVVPGDDVR